MSCDRCDGSGLIPFVKSGKVIPFAFLHCTCHPIYGDNPEPEHYHPISPDDYDYPMSETFRAFTYQYCGVPDPGYIPQGPEPVESKPREIIHRHADMGKAEFDLLQQTARKIEWLEKKLTEKTKPESKYGYKGIK